jgi:MFS family permease
MDSSTAGKEQEETMRVEIKGTPEEYIKLRPKQRIFRWRWWFVLLVIVGIVAAVVALTREANQIHQIRNLSDIGVQLQSPSLVAFLPIAFLQGATSGENSGTTSDKTRTPQEELVRSYIMVGIFMMIGIITIVALLAVLFSKSEKTVAAASDLLKTCVGFFIGVATGWL